MASGDLTVRPAGTGPLVNPHGERRVVTGTLHLSDAYTQGGEAVLPVAFGLAAIDFILFGQTADLVTQYTYDPVNGLIYAFVQTPGDEETRGDEVEDDVDLSADVVPFVAFGY